MVDAMEQFTEAAFALLIRNHRSLNLIPFMLKPDEAFREHFLGRGLLNMGPSASIIEEIFLKVKVALG